MNNNLANCNIFKSSLLMDRKWINLLKKDCSLTIQKVALIVILKNTSFKDS